MPALYGHSYSVDEMKVRWGKEGWFFHRSDSNTDSEITFIPQETFHPEIIERAIEDAWDTCKESLAPDHLFMGNGCDSTAPDNVVDKIVSYVNTKFVSSRRLVVRRPPVRLSHRAYRSVHGG